MKGPDDPGRGLLRHLSEVGGIKAKSALFLILGLLAAGLLLMEWYFARSQVPRVRDAPLPQAAYLWQRQWSEPVRVAAASAIAERNDFHELLVAGAEIVAGDSRGEEGSVVSVNGIDWSLLASSRRPLGLVIRVRGAPSVIGAKGDVFWKLRAASVDLLVRAQRAGVKLEEVQVDFGCPTARLGGFTEVMSALRREFPSERWTFTVLPAWLHSPAFATLARESAGYVLQVHSSVALGADRHPPTTLCDPHAPPYTHLSVRRRLVEHLIAATPLPDRRQGLMETHVQTANQRPTSSTQVVATCEICGHGYNQGVEVVAYGQSQRFHSFACAIQALAPRCAHCRRHIVGRGPAATGATFCCDRCAKLPCSRPLGLFRDMASQTTN